MLELISMWASIMCVLCVVAIPVLLIMFIVSCAKKKPQKWLGLSAFFCFAGTIVFALIGSQTELMSMTPEERTAYELKLEQEEQQREEEKAEKEKKKQEEKAAKEKIEEEKKAAAESKKAEEKAVAESKKAEAERKAKEEEERKEQERLAVTFKEIYDAYQNNSLAADDKYKGNRYRITGKIEGVGDDGLNGLLGNVSVTVITYADNTPCVLWCTFDKETQREELSKFIMGETITFDGVCDSWGNWYDCELVFDD